MKEQSNELPPPIPSSHQPQPQKGKFKPIPIIILLIAVLGIGYTFLAPDLTNIFGLSGRTDALTEGLKGKVKQVADVTFYAQSKFGKWEIADPENSIRRLRTVYDENGMITLTESYDLEGNLERKMQVNYPEGVIKEMNLYLPNGELIGKMVYQSLGDNKEVLSQYDKEGELRGKEIYFFEDAKIIRSERPASINNDNSFYSIFTYDENDNVISEKIYRNEDTGAVFLRDEVQEYLEKDSHGNWIKKVSTGSGVPTIDVRTIEYY